MCSFPFLILCSMWVGGHQQLLEVKIAKQFIFQITSSQWTLLEISVKRLIGVLKPTWPLVIWMLIRLMWGEHYLFIHNDFYPFNHLNSIWHFLCSNFVQCFSLCRILLLICAKSWPRILKLSSRGCIEEYFWTISILKIRLSWLVLYLTKGCL